jgi:hypothetical protein
VEADDPETAVSRIIELVKTRIPKRFTQTPLDDRLLHAFRLELERNGLADQGAFGFAQLAAEFGRITADQVPKPAADRRSTFVDSARPFETLSRVVDRTGADLR